MTYSEEMAKLSLAITGVAVLTPDQLERAYIESCALSFGALFAFGDPLTPVLITGLADGDFIRYDAGSGFWKNTPVSAADVNAYPAALGYAGI